MLKKVYPCSLHVNRPLRLRQEQNKQEIPLPYNEISIEYEGITIQYGGAGGQENCTGIKESDEIQRQNRNTERNPVAPQISHIAQGSSSSPLKAFEACNELNITKATTRQIQLKHIIYFSQSFKVTVWQKKRHVHFQKRCY